MTYRQLEHLSRRYGAVLAATGVTRGQRLVWWSDADMRSLAGFAAAARLGAVFAPLNPAYSPGEAGAALEYLRPSLIVAGHGQFEAARDLSAGVPVVTVDDLDARSAPQAASTAPPGPDDGDPHIIYLTSGTTGRPKGVVVSHRASWLRSFPGGSTFAAGLRGEGGILVSFPLFHYGGWHYVLEAWHHRTAFHICARFDGPTLVEAAQRWGPTALYCIPAVWNRVLEAAPGGAGLESVRHADTGTSAAPPELLERIRAALPEATTSVLYGSSEGGHHTTLHHREVERYPGSVGRVAPPGVIRLSEEGEILYRSPTLMDGYFDRPEETDAALAGGWYHTGDLGVMDDDGYLWITGRAREVIRSGGEYVAPVEVEQALAGLPGARDLAVVGVADPQWGEVVTLAVVVAEGAGTPTVAEVRSRLEGRIASFKHPRRVVAVPAVPRTPATGQVQRTLLRDLVVEQLG
jgi:fatty-acyl-CoA synthase